MSSIINKYIKKYQTALVPLAKALEKEIFEYLKDYQHIDKISVRAKSVDSFIKKSITRTNGKLKYSDPLNQIQDQIGARIVTFYLSDVPAVSECINKYYRKIETCPVVPDSDKEFGYFGFHNILLTPPELIPDGKDTHLYPPFFEIQIVTLFQHAWAEANHDLGYKPEKPLTKDQHRRIAFTSAQAWGADFIFDELWKELNKKE